MTPQLQQAIRLLQLPIMELQTQIQDALEQNVMLEAEEPEAAEPLEAAEEVADEAEIELPTDTEWDDAQRTGPSEAPRSGDSDMRFEQADHSEETLKDHLLWQLELENLDPRTTAIGQAVIDAINDDGYLTDDLATIRATLAPDILTNEDEIEAVLAQVQNFDPVGIAARSVSECVLLQLGQLPPDTAGLELARRVASEHLELVAELLFAVMHGLLHGGRMPLFSLIWAEYFGRNSLGSIFSFSSPFRMTANAIGPIFAALFFDFTGRYTIPFCIFIALFLFVGAISLYVKPPDLPSLKAHP